MFNFIGCGSAFNTELGNNSAYIKQDGTLFMIDCGSANFDRIKRSGLLEGVNDIVVLLTHTHPDHVGSLGDLIFYSYYCMGNIGEKNITILSPYSLKIHNILRGMGISSKTYELSQFDNRGEYHSDTFRLEFQVVPMSHVPEILCYGYVIEYGGSTIYYSGDSNYISPYILQKLEEGYFDYFYQDTCKADYEGNVHLSLRKLSELVWGNRNRVYCMHLDEKFDVAEAKELGFNVVESNLNI